MGVIKNNHLSWINSLTGNTSLKRKEYDINNDNMIIDVIDR